MKKLVFAPALLALVACEAVDSDAVTTAGVYANIDATADGSGSTRTTAILKVGGATSNTYLDLVAGDSLEATHDGETQELEKQSFGDYREYTADWEVDAVDSSFSVAFVREVDEGAPATTVSLPEPFEITSPEADLTFSRDDDDIVVAWDVTADEPMKVDITGECFWVEAEDIDVDDGTVTFPADSLEPYEDRESETCTATISVWRTRAGDLDPGYGEGGIATGKQVRTVSVLSGP